MGQVVSRAIMWMLIVAGVWYVSQEWKSAAPSEEQHEMMMDAARHYQNYKMHVEQSEGRLESDVPRVR